MGGLMTGCIFLFTGRWATTRGGGGAYKRQFMVYNSRHESFTLLVNKKQHEIILESVYWYGNCILCKEDENS